LVSVDLHLIVDRLLWHIFCLLSACSWFVYRGGMEGWVVSDDLGGWIYAKVYALTYIGLITVVLSPLKILDFEAWLDLAYWNKLIFWTWYCCNSRTISNLAHPVTCLLQEC